MITTRNNVDNALSAIRLKLGKLYPDHEFGSELIRTAALTVSAEIKHRVQNDGKASDGSTIGQYSTTPIYIPLASNIGKSIGRPLGKLFAGKRRSVFKSGEREGLDHKSRYFERGYKEYKTAIGRNILGTVNLTLSGQMFGAMTVLPTREGWGIGWSATAFAKRARFFEDKYGKGIYKASVDERRLAIKVIKRMMSDAFS